MLSFVVKPRNGKSLLTSSAIHKAIADNKVKKTSKSNSRNFEKQLLVKCRGNINVVVASNVDGRKPLFLLMI